MANFSKYNQIFDSHSSSTINNQKAKESSSCAPPKLIDIETEFTKKSTDNAANTDLNRFNSAINFLPSTKKTQSSKADHHKKEPKTHNFSITQTSIVQFPPNDSQLNHSNFFQRNNRIFLLQAQNHQNHTSLQILKKFEIPKHLSLLIHSSRIQVCPLYFPKKLKYQKVVPQKNIHCLILFWTMRILKYYFSFSSRI
jgi:hypothetical protein